MENIILITGATSGFGKAIAQKFSENKWNCIITGRREERLQQLADELSSKFNVQILPLVFDVQQRNETFYQIENLPAQWKAIDILVNNAGLALGRESFDIASLDDWETMIDTNVKGLLFMSKAVLPLMMARGGADMLLISDLLLQKKYMQMEMFIVLQSLQWTP